MVVRAQGRSCRGDRAGVLTPQEACERYMLSPEELFAWETSLDQNGIPGLRVTRLQMYRRAPLEKRP